MKALIIDDEPLARNELTYLLNELVVLKKLMRQKM